jgi:hypothetical protein
MDSGQSSAVVARSSLLIVQSQIVESHILKARSALRGVNVPRLVSGTIVAPRLE